MAFASTTENVWPVTPDWTHGVTESLAWATDVTQSSSTLQMHHRSVRLSPRRGISFDVLAGESEHRVIDMLLAGHRGIWLLPIWPDVQWLTTPLAANTREIPCSTAGFDFVEGGKALLYTSYNKWQVVEIESVETDHIAVSDATLAAYGRGARLYPLRRARVSDGAEAQMLSDRTSRRRLNFEIAESCGWPELPNVGGYLGHRVLDVRPDESEDPAYGYAGLQEVVDFGAALPVVSDLPGIALRAQRDGWKLLGRDSHTWFRSLLYTLRGRQRTIWVPSWSADIKPVAAVAGNSTGLSIEWAGYTQFGFGKPNRRDLRIELFDGKVYYRRVIASAETGETETLTLSSPLDSASIAPGRIRQVSFLALCTLASDAAEINHLTDADGTATATTGWQGVIARA